MIESRRQIATDLVSRRSRSVDDLVHQPDFGSGVKRQSAGEHLIQHNAEGKYIGPLVHLLALGLLRRHVGGGSEYGPRPRQVHRANASLGTELAGTRLVHL